MALPELVIAHREKLSRYTLPTLLASRRLWARLRETDLDGTYPGAQLLALLMAGQFAAATEGAAFVPLVLAEQGIDPDQVGDVRPRSLVGVASSGVPLEMLAMTPLLRAKALIGQGYSPVLAMESARALLDGIVTTQLADAARDAELVAMAVTPTATAYVRTLNLPSCKRCVQLAGRVYRSEEAFDRHPGCDCTHLPSSLDGARDQVPDIRQLIKDGQVRGLSKADTKAIVEHGADPNRVINATRNGGATRAQVPADWLPGATSSRKVSTVGYRNTAGKRVQSDVRLRPESIFDIAGGDKAKATRLLKEHGYIKQTAEQARLARAAARRSTASGGSRTPPPPDPPSTNGPGAGGRDRPRRVLPFRAVVDPD